MHIQLPGGLVVNDEIHHLVRFRPITGKIELLVASQVDLYLGRPAWVSEVLAASIEVIGSIETSVAVANHLTVGDRIFLMLQLGIRYSGDRIWLTPTCESCGEKFDCNLQRSEFPVQKASSDYPYAVLNIKGREICVRAVNGEDQQWLNQHPSRHNAVLALLRRCVQTVDGEPPAPSFIKSLNKKNRDLLESAIQDIGPDVDCSLLVRCPECSSVQELEFDPYYLGQTLRSNLDNEIHALAYNYHWSESEILYLTRERRQTFLKLIDKERGVYA